jgi:leader peptidase (prepilin peptidase)/N-methyltransferase
MMLAALGGLAGLVIGSFIAALTARWPQGKSIVAGRSRCDQCDRELGPFELVPVISFAVQGGKCRHCSAAIAPRYPAIELAAAGLGAAALALHPGAHGVAGAVFGWWLLALLVLDVEHMWLPDRLTIPLGLAGLAVAAGLGQPLVDHLIGAAAGWMSLAGIAAGYRLLTGRTGMGGGDPKLFAAIGAWLGWVALPFVLVFAALLGLMLVGYDRLSGRPVTRHSRVPLGALLAAAAFPLWLAGPLAI